MRENPEETVLFFQPPSAARVMAAKALLTATTATERRPAGA
jgi:hypothetical protein